MKLKKLKAAIAVILSLTIIFSLALPSFAVELTLEGSRIPVVMIAGDGAPLSDENDVNVFQFNKMFSNGTFKKDELFKSIVEILKPYILEGRLTGNYDNYYKAIYEEIGKLFENVRLNKDGEVDNGVGLDGWREWCNWDAQNNDHKGDKGYYSFEDYQFWYDWRKDPLEIADEFNTYVENLKRVTGCDKINVVSRCLGTNIIMAYIAKYGTDSLHGLALNGATVMGIEPLSETASGKFNLDGDAIVRFLYDSNAMDLLHIDQFVIDTVDLLEDAGVLQFVEDYTKLTVYDKVKHGVTSALALSTFYTWPGYWAGVSTEDYEMAKYYVFGDRGSEKRQEYAGLIQKLDNYDATVRRRLPALLDQIKNSGINVGVVAKYGAQMAPVCKSNDEIADQIASVKRASFGATTSTVYGTLSEEYINQRISEGKGRYISPDRQIDASTCKFPDSTWFLKGARHSNWTDFENKICYTLVTADRQLTIDDFGFSQFRVYDDETQESVDMTAQNCDVCNWEANEKEDKSKNPFIRIGVFMKTLVRWYKSLFVFIGERAEARRAEKETEPTEPVTGATV